MGLCHRIVCVLLYDGAGLLVKGEGFARNRRVGDVLQAARVHARRQVDELVLLDVTASQEGRGPSCALVERVTRTCFVPVAAGGGVRTSEDVRRLLRAGADKVVLGTAAVECPTLLPRLARRFGSQCLTVAIDVGSDGSVWTCSGTYPTRRDAGTVARQVTTTGAGEILLTSIGRDGTMEGYDLDLCRCVRADVDVPLVLAGGAGTYAHLAEGLAAGADAVAAGAMWQFTEQTPAGAARYLAERGYPVRLPERMAA